MSIVKPIPVNLPFETVPARQDIPKTPGEEWADNCPPRHKAEMHWQVLVRSLPWGFQDDERARVFVEYCTKDLGISKELAIDVMRWGQ